MNAILLAAGKATRLRPISKKKPKCLIKIGKINMLDFWIENLLKLGVKKILINTHYLHDQIVDHIRSHPQKNKIKITYEKNLLGTAGTLLKNLDFFENDGGFFLHADNYTKQSLKPFQDAHNKRPKNCTITMMKFKTLDPKNSGIVKTDSKKRMIKFYEKKKTVFGNIANGAIYLLSKKFIKNYKKINSRAKDFSKDIIPRCKQKVYCFHTNEFFIDMGTIKNLNLLKKKLKQNSF
jgi:mannose-1-phosphate guanylyltransferase